MIAGGGTGAFLKTAKGIKKTHKLTKLLGNKGNTAKLLNSLAMMDVEKQLRKKGFRKTAKFYDLTEDAFENMLEYLDIDKPDFDDIHKIRRRDDDDDFIPDYEKDFDYDDIDTENYDRDDKNDDDIDYDEKDDDDNNKRQRDRFEKYDDDNKQGS